MKKFIVLVLALMLAACGATTGGVTIENGKTSGMESRDAAWAMATKSSNEAVVDLEKARKPTCDMEIKGTITDLKFACYGESKNAGAIQRVERPKSEFAENIGAVADGTAKVLGAATPIVGIVQGAGIIKNGQNTSLESQRISAQSNQAIASQGIEAAGKDPLVVGPSEGFRVLNQDQ